MIKTMIEYLKKKKKRKKGRENEIERIVYEDKFEFIIFGSRKYEYLEKR